LPLTWAKATPIVEGGLRRRGGVPASEKHVPLGIGNRYGVDRLLLQKKGEGQHRGGKNPNFRWLARRGWEKRKEAWRLGDRSWSRYKGEKRESTVGGKKSIIGIMGTPGQEKGFSGGRRDDIGRPLGIII